ncbi:sugar phosphate isomerase/epimerase family protein [Brachybacterium sp. GCM10030267]|uniref:sugar phosphate isomerase/epimerase family protein n=1 Tax=unclassified Brachybacterium TaxID=2623841 RepID=UPI00361ABD08
MPLHPHVVCSTISFRRQPLDRALSVISELGFAEVDLGALPGVCDHVPYDLTGEAVGRVAETFQRFGSTVRSINADIGDLNRALDEGERAGREAHLCRLLELADSVGAQAIVLPCGSQGQEPLDGLRADVSRVASALRWAAQIAYGRGVQIWVEAQHSGRLCHSRERADLLLTELEDSDVRTVLDVSHVVAAGDDIPSWIERWGHRIAHVHLRDARPGDIHLTPGNGDVDFPAAIAALKSAGYAGAYSLELETADVAEEDRPAAALRAGTFISSLL